MKGAGWGAGSRSLQWSNTGALRSMVATFLPLAAMMSQPEEPSGNGLTVSGWRLTSFAIISMSSVSTIVGLHHLVAAHGGKQTEDVGLVSPDNEVERLLGHSGVGRHVLLMKLFLIGDGDDDVALTLLYLDGCVCLPQGFVLLERRVAVHEVEKMIVCLFHCLNMRLGPGWLSPISSRRMSRWLVRGRPANPGAMSPV